VKRIVVMGDGFIADELDTFRCATALLVEGVLSSYPFDQHPIEVLRLDLSIPDSDPNTPNIAGLGLTPGGSCTACQQYPGFDKSHADCGTFRTASSAYAIEIASGGGAPSCLEAPLNTKYCASSGFCYLVWPTGEGHGLAVDLATTCVEGADMVVIIANTNLGQPAGGGLYDYSTNSFPLAVVSLYDLEISLAPGVPDVRWVHLAHELGHAFGLLDEKTSRGAAAYQKGRNVFSRGELEAGEPCSWAWSCNPFQVSPPFCHINACRPDPSVTNPQPTVGLWEGAFYCNCSDNPCHCSNDPITCESHCYEGCSGFYRAEESCRMKKHHDDFCVACVRGIGDFFRSRAIIDPGTVSVLDRLDRTKLELLSRHPPESPWLIDGDPLDVDAPGVAQFLANAVSRPVGRFSAQVELSGVIGEMEIDAMRVEVEGPRTWRGELVVRRKLTEIHDRLEWLIDGVPLDPTPVALEDALPAIVRAKPAGAIRVMPRFGTEEVTARRVDIELYSAD
jgi:hypothetical protein